MSNNSPELRVQSASLLSTIVLHHGPLELMGRVLSVGFDDAMAKGVTVELGSFEELVWINMNNKDSWGPLVPTLDPRLNDLRGSDAFCILCRDRDGNAVAAHAARHFDWTKTNFHNEINCQRLFYADPAKARSLGHGAFCNVLEATTVSGHVAFSGAAWCHPNFRKVGLSRIVPRLGKLIAKAWWDVDYIVGLMLADVHAKGFAPRFGYTNVHAGVTIALPDTGSFPAWALWMTDDDLYSYLGDYFSFARPQVDRAIANGSG
jgi:hypothetical protein